MHTPKHFYFFVGINFSNLVFKGNKQMSQKIKLGKAAIKSKIKLFSSAMDIPEDPFGKASRITLIGSKEAIVDGCFGIIEYSENLVKINTSSGPLSFFGTDFTVCDYSCNSITLRGNILNIEFGG